MYKYALYKEYYKQLIYNELSCGPGMYKNAGLMQLLGKVKMSAANLAPRLERALPPTGPMSLAASYTRDPRVVNAYNKLTGKPFMANINGVNVTGKYNDVFNQARKYTNTMNNPLKKNGPQNMFKNNIHDARRMVQPNNMMTPGYNKVTGTLNDMTHTLENSGFGLDDLIGMVNRTI